MQAMVGGLINGGMLDVDDILESNFDDWSGSHFSVNSGYDVFIIHIRKLKPRNRPKSLPTNNLGPTRLPGEP
jgi:hypothetical protein